jgi:hypothetical protein
VAEATPWPLGVVRPPSRAKKINFFFLIWPSATPNHRLGGGRSHFMALGGGSANPKGQIHFKNNFFLPLGVAIATPWPNIVFIFYFSFLLFLFLF